MMHSGEFLRKAGGWLVVVLLGLLASTGWTQAQVVPRTVFAGHVPAAISQLKPLGRLAPATRLKLSIHLSVHHRAELDQLLAQLYDPASPQYHHYLTPDQFDARFGPTEADYQAVIAWATRNGLSVTVRHPNRMLLEVSAAVPDIERALQVTLRTYPHPTEARAFFAPDTEPSADASLPVAYIGGLDNFARPHPRNLHRTPLKVTARATSKMGSGPNGNLAGYDYRAVYAPGVTLTGAGQQVGLLEFDGYYAGDITQYQSQTGVPNVPVQTTLLDGFDGVPTTGSTSANGEVALDIEMVTSMAPGLSQVNVYEAGPNGLPNDILQAMSTDTATKQFSSSWDFGILTPAQRNSMDTYFMKFGLQGQSFFDASGDTGATNAVNEAPDDDAYVTQVGGTTLATTGQGGNWMSEVAWNAGEGPGFAGTSGGISTTYPLPAWQKGVSMSANKGSASYRDYPDVAAVADNIFLVADNGQLETSGGTSAAAPLWAGFAALINQQAAAVGGTANSVGFLNPALYHLGTNSGYTACFNDVRSGNNTNFNANQYLAVPGYDLCTGWGSPAGSSLIIALTGPDGFQITPGQNAVANGPAGGPFTLTNLTLVLTNTGRSAFAWSLGNDSSWLNVSASTGTLTPGGGANLVSVTLNATASQLPAGVYTANLWFTNLNSGLAQLRQFTLLVGQELVQDGGFNAGDFCYWNLSGNAGIYTNNFVDNGTITGYTPYAGNDFAALGEIGALSQLSQTLPTRAGQAYRLSVWLENPTPSTAYNQFEIQWISGNSASTIFNQADMGTFGWTNLVFLVRATTNATTLQFVSRSDISLFALDSVSVVPIYQNTPVVTWTNPAAITYGAALSKVQLNATADIPGSWSYSPSSGVVLNAGTNTLTATFTPTDGLDYNTVTISTSLTVLKVVPAFTWTNPAAIYYSTALSPLQLNARANVAGSEIYSPPTGTLLNAGTNLLTAVFTPNNPLDYASVTSSVSLVVYKSAPYITWTNPAALVYGSSLGATQLNARANIPGAFFYTPATGTVLGAGTNKLTAVFTPTNTADFNNLTSSVNLVIHKATPLITWSNPSAITYGVVLGQAQLDAAASVPGSFAYSPANGTTLNAGTNKLTAVFAPTDNVDYNRTTNSVNLSVLKVTPIVAWTNPLAVTYGTALNATQLNASASVPGTFAYSPATGTVLSAGTNALKAVFAPTNKVDFNSVTSSVSLIVFKAIPVIKWTNPPAITYGTALSTAQLKASVNVSGTLLYSPASGTVLSAGTNLLTAVFTPSSKVDYASVTSSVSLIVFKATPVIKWTAPAAITNGTALTAKQLDATASVPGTFDYVPAMGIILSAGTNALTAVFTPTNAADYSSVTSSVSLIVKPVPVAGAKLVTARVAGDRLVLGGANAVAGETYVVWMSTNLMLPFNQWNPVATNQAGTNGNFILTVTNAASLPTPQGFYLINKQ